jgi:peptidoglycan/LPS O-acetylase OafA/YrhL
MKDRARMIIALLAGIIFIVLNAFFPTLPFTEDQTIIFIGLIAAYILGEGLEGVRIADNLKYALRSHKLQALVAGLIIVAVKSFLPNFPLTEAQLTELISILAVLILGAGVQGAIDNATIIKG